MCPYAGRGRSIPPKGPAGRNLPCSAASELGGASSGGARRSGAGSRSLNAAGYARAAVQCPLTLSLLAPAPWRAQSGTGRKCLGEGSSTRCMERSDGLQSKAVCSRSCTYGPYRQHTRAQVGRWDLPAPAWGLPAARPGWRAHCCDHVLCFYCATLIEISSPFCAATLPQEGRGDQNVRAR